jgi:hypothetical protein
MSNIIVFFSLIVIMLFLWHMIFINSLANHIVTQQISDSLYSLPAYNYFKELQHHIPLKICNIDVFNNEIHFCQIGIYQICKTEMVPSDIMWADPYYLLKPLLIKICI